MILKRIEIENFRGIQSLELSPNRRVTVLCGINGVGKSTILDAISYQISWFISRLRSTRGSGKPIKVLDLPRGASYAQLTGEYEIEDRLYTVSLAKTKPGHLHEAKSDMTGFSQAVDA